MEEPAVLLARLPLRLPLRERSVMHKGRLEAFTDGVIAIIITIMVLEMKAPPGADLASLASTLPVFITYALSYTNVAMFWNNHHHMLQVSERVDGRTCFCCFGFPWCRS